MNCTRTIGLLEHARRLGGALDALRAAALTAAAHRTRSELAADLGTKNTALFHRLARPSDHAVGLASTSIGPAPPGDVTDQQAS